MKFTFTEKKMDSSEDLRAYAVRKISKLDRFFKTEAEAFVTFSISRGRFLAEITIHNNGLYYRASELTNDMYASVDSGVAAIERQIRRNKTRLAKRLREGALEREAVPAYVPAEDEEQEFAQSASPSSPCLRRRLFCRWICSAMNFSCSRTWTLTTRSPLSISAIRAVTA